MRFSRFAVALPDFDLTQQPGGCCAGDRILRQQLALDRARLPKRALRIIGLTFGKLRLRQLAQTESIALPD